MDLCLFKPLFHNIVYPNIILGVMFCLNIFSFDRTLIQGHFHKNSSSRKIEEVTNFLIFFYFVMSVYYFSFELFDFSLLWIYEYLS